MGESLKYQSTTDRVFESKMTRTWVMSSKDEGFLLINYRMEETYKGEPLEKMYELWMAHKAKQEASHQKKLERDRKAKATYRARQKAALQATSN
jgi:hypothetical protein